MSRLESISPLVVAWAVSLGLGGLLLILAFSDETSVPGEAVGHFAECRLDRFFVQCDLFGLPRPGKIEIGLARSPIEDG